MNEATLLRDGHNRPARQTNEASGQSIRLGDKRDPKKKALAPDRWWWTLAREEAACESCAKQMSVRQKIAYHFNPTRLYCLDCARKLGISSLCRPSKKLQRTERSLELHDAKTLELRKALLKP